MRLLVSVRSAEEAREALEGGADIIDAKEPSRGAMGSVAHTVLREIRDVVDRERPMSAALGDAVDDRAVADAARRSAALGMAYVKIGFLGIRDPMRVGELLRSAMHGAHAADAGAQVIAVAYADAECAKSLSPETMIDTASRAGAHGVLLDTACKAGGGLLELMSASAIGRWVESAHDAALTVALAGKLQRDDLPTVATLGADIVGVRGAACDGGREGRVTLDRVRALADIIHRKNRVVPPPQSALSLQRSV